MVQILAVNCGKPVSPDHGYVIGKDFLFMDVVVIQCDEGYAFSQKEDSMRCLADGIWEENLGVCESKSNLYSQLVNSLHVLKHFKKTSLFMG